MNNNSTASRYEVDCPWFDPTWLLDHPEFPLAASVAEHIPEEEGL